MATSTGPRPAGWYRPVFSVVPLQQMRGPMSGLVSLPLSVHSSGAGPREEFDFADPASRRAAYQIILTNGDANDAAQLLDADELLRLWPSLWLPAHVRRAWEPHLSHSGLNADSDAPMRGRGVATLAVTAWDAVVARAPDSKRVVPKWRSTRPTGERLPASSGP